MSPIFAPYLGSYNTHFAKYPGPLLGITIYNESFLVFLGCFEVGARLYEVSMHSTLQCLVVLILSRKSYKLGVVLWVIVCYTEDS